MVNVSLLAKLKEQPFHPGSFDDTFSKTSPKVSLYRGYMEQNNISCREDENSLRVGMVVWKLGLYGKNGGKHLVDNVCHGSLVELEIELWLCVWRIGKMSG